MTASKEYTRTYKQTLSVLQSMRRIQVATLVAVGLLSAFIAVMTFARSRQIEELQRHDVLQDNRLDALEHRGDPTP